MITLPTMLAWGKTLANVLIDSYSILLLLQFATQTKHNNNKTNQEEAIVVGEQ